MVELVDHRVHVHVASVFHEVRELWQESSEERSRLHAATWGQEVAFDALGWLELLDGDVAGVVLSNTTNDPSRRSRVGALLQAALPDTAFCEWLETEGTSYPRIRQMLVKLMYCRCALLQAIELQRPLADQAREGL